MCSWGTWQWAWDRKCEVGVLICWRVEELSWARAGKPVRLHTSFLPALHCGEDMVSRFQLLPRLLHNDGLLPESVSYAASARVFYHSNRNKTRTVTQPTCAGTRTSSPCPQLGGTLEAFRRLTGIKTGFPPFFQCTGRHCLKLFEEGSVKIDVNVKLGENSTGSPLRLESF